MSPKNVARPWQAYALMMFVVISFLTLFLLLGSKLLITIWLAVAVASTGHWSLFVASGIGLLFLLLIVIWFILAFIGLWTGNYRSPRFFLRFSCVLIILSTLAIFADVSRAQPGVILSILFLLGGAFLADRCMKNKFYAR